MSQLPSLVREEGEGSWAVDAHKNCRLLLVEHGWLIDLGVYFGGLLLFCLFFKSVVNMSFGQVSRI